MYYSTSRVLAVLDLLLMHGQMRGEDIASYLEVDARTVRRYVMILRERGIPVEMKRGRHGGYTLPTGYRQPLALTKEEALALTYGFLGAGQKALGLDEQGAARTLKKVTRVLPSATRALIGALEGAVTFASARLPVDIGAAPDCLDTLVRAIHVCHGVHIRHCSQAGVMTERDVDLHQVVHRAGRWYLVAHCHLRAALRVFRVDHIQRAMELAETFTLPSMDALAAVEQSIAQTPWRWEFAVLAAAPLATLRNRMPSTVATFHQQADGVMLRGFVDDLEWLAAALASLRCPLVLVRPPELRDHIRALADRLRTIADQSASVGD
ncbi:MAG TPA: WYL domain-containing protein [Ktedonobacterales bacterium]|nr:WYL domain-containing protein [Ktedonobacterales bacterium]